MILKSVSPRPWTDSEASTVCVSREFAFRFVRSYIIGLRSHLEQQSSGYQVIVSSIVGIIPVFDHLSKHGTGFPPIIRWVCK